MSDNGRPSDEVWEPLTDEQRARFEAAVERGMALHAHDAGKHEAGPVEGCPLCQQPPGAAPSDTPESFDPVTDLLVDIDALLNTDERYESSASKVNRGSISLDHRGRRLRITVTDLGPLDGDHG